MFEGKFLAELQLSHFMYMVVIGSRCEADQSLYPVRFILQYDYPASFYSLYVSGTSKSLFCHQQNSLAHDLWPEAVLKVMLW